MTINNNTNHNKLLHKFLPIAGGGPALTPQPPRFQPFFLLGIFFSLNEIKNEKMQ
jgi:hypothetical protein